MKIYYSDESIEKIQKIAQKIEKKKYTSLLIQIYSGILKEKKIKKLLKILNEIFPKAIIIGASTAGEVAQGKISEESIQISYSLFKHTKIKADYVPTTDKKSAKKLIHSVKQKEMKAAILLSEGLHGNHIDFLNTINSNFPSLVISGGLAGDNFNLEKTFLIFQDKIYFSGSVGVTLASKKLYANNAYNLSWIPIGKEFVVTRSEGTRVEMIDDMVAVDFFKHYLGEDILSNLPHSLLEFQLLFHEGDTVIARTPMAIDGDALIFAAPVDEGQKVQFGFSNAETILANANQITQKIEQKPAEAIFIFSCIARKSLLQEKLEEEIKIFNAVAPTYGFITYGEYYRTETNNALLNCTTTLLLLSESKKIKKRAKHFDDKKFKLGENTFNSLLHFIHETTHELDKKIVVLDQYKTIVDSALLVSKTDTNGIITYVNDKFAEVSGYTEEELIGKNHNIVRHPDMKPALFQNLWSTIQAKKIWQGTVKNMAKDGKTYVVKATVSPILDKEGNIEEFIALRQNITAEFIKEQNLKEKESEQRAIVDNQDVIILFAKKSTGVQMLNRRFFELFDYKDLEDFKAKHSCICELFIEEEGYIYPCQRADWLDFVASNPDERHKVKMQDKFGNIRIFLLKVKIFGDKFVVSITDITDLENALLKAHVSEHAKSMFLANMSHEIRTPLNGILGFTDLLRKRELAPKEKQYVDIIHRSGDTLLNIVNDILDISKIESGEMSLEVIPSNIALDVESVVAVFASKAKEKQLQYNVFIDPKIPKSLYCDAQRIKQVLTNLISNAIKFTPEDGEINVNVVRVKNVEDSVQIHFEVKDSGIGIPEDKIAKVFQPFSQADDSTSRKYGGTGLGLPISARFVEMMGSKIKIKSKPDHGTKFYFDIKLKVNDSQTYLETNSADAHIALLKYEDKRCYASVTSYLKAWEQNFSFIDSLEELHANVNILILCSDLVNQLPLNTIMKHNPNMHIICLDRANGLDNSENTSEYFHHLEQPITGSMLYDALMDYSQSSVQNVLVENLNPKNNTQKYNGYILVAEDNEVNQLLISTLLEEKGLQYKIANNGEELIELYEKEKQYADIIFMDINMPILDGLGATKELRERGYEIPIIALTANVMAEDKEIYIKSGMQDFLSKPIVPQELERVLKKYMTDDSSAQDKPQNQPKVEDIRYDSVSLEFLSKELGLHNPQIIKRLLKTFLESAQGFIDSLEAMLESEDYTEAEMLLHQIKGVAANLRFNETYQLTQTLEKEARENRLTDVEEKFKQLIMMLKALREKITKEVE